MAIGILRQTSIYRAGVSGRRPRVPTDATKLEARARKAMPEEAFAYIARGAGTGATMRANRGALDRGGRGHGRDKARQPRRVRPLEDRAAHAARRLGARHERRALRSPPAVP